VQLLSKTPASEGVCSDASEKKCAKSKVDEIKHARYRLGSSETMASIYVKNPFELMDPSIRAALSSNVRNPPKSHENTSQSSFLAHISQYHLHEARGRKIFARLN
jgi:hypothetical protein